MRITLAEKEIREIKLIQTTNTFLLFKKVCPAYTKPLAIDEYACISAWSDGKMYDIFITYPDPKSRQSPPTETRSIIVDYHSFAKAKEDTLSVVSDILVQYIDFSTEFKFLIESLCPVDISKVLTDFFKEEDHFNEFILLVETVKLIESECEERKRDLAKAKKLFQTHLTKIMNMLQTKSHNSRIAPVTKNHVDSVIEKAPLAVARESLDIDKLATPDSIAKCILDAVDGLY